MHVKVWNTIEWCNLIFCSHKCSVWCSRLCMFIPADVTPPTLFSIIAKGCHSWVHACTVGLTPYIHFCSTALENIGRRALHVMLQHYVHADIMFTSHLFGNLLIFSAWINQNTRPKQQSSTCIWDMSPAVACVKSSRGVYLLVIDLNLRVRSLTAVSDVQLRLTGLTLMCEVCQNSVILTCHL